MTKLQTQIIEYSKKNYGFCYGYSEAEEIKSKAHAVLRSNKPIDDKLKAAENVFKAHFSRSILACTKDQYIKHVGFDSYVSMRLNSKATCLLIMDEDVYAALIQKYGTKPGIKDGSSYYIVGKQKN